MTVARPIRWLAAAGALAFAVVGAMVACTTASGPETVCVIEVVEIRGEQRRVLCGARARLARGEDCKELRESVSTPTRCWFSEAQIPEAAAMS
jgi:hypothetical protein